MSGVRTQLKNKLSNLQQRFPRLHRWAKLIMASLKCDVYLLFVGMWRGECKFTAWDHSNRIILIMTVTGSIFRNTIKEQKVFYAECPNKTERPADFGVSPIQKDRGL